MIKSTLENRDLITTIDWDKSQLMQVLQMGEEMKKKRYSPEFNSILQNKNFIMLLYSPSLISKISFEAAASELGGNALCVDTSLAPPEELVKKIEGYGCGLGVRAVSDNLNFQGEGNRILRKISDISRVPVINMGDGKFDPCRGLAEIMSYRENLGKDLSDKKIAYLWQPGKEVFSPGFLHESMLLSSRMGMDISLACPGEYTPDEQVLKSVRRLCKEKGTFFSEESNLSEIGSDNHIVCAGSWARPGRYEKGEVNLNDEVKKASEFKDWKIDEGKISLSSTVFYSGPDKAGGKKNSLYYDIIQNRLHIQKALMALIMGY